MSERSEQSSAERAWMQYQDGSHARAAVSRRGAFLAGFAEGAASQVVVASKYMAECDALRDQLHRMGMVDDSPGVLIGRVLIAKYATDDDVIVSVETSDGSGGELPLIDGLGLVAFGSAHLAGLMNGHNDEASA